MESAAHAVILAGGKGTRFWPKSRARRPKQLLPIVSERTMIEETLARIAPIAPPGRVWVVTGAEHAAEVRRQLPSVRRSQVVVEPSGRNTAAAIGLAAHLVGRTDPEATLIILPADHHVGAPKRFEQALKRAVDFARHEDALVTIGIRPTAPETGYGYVEIGEELSRGVNRARRFVEKPDRAQAKGLVTSGRHLWNSGILVARARSLRDGLSRYLPETERRLAKIVARWGDAKLFARLYREIEDRSIDYGVLEKAANVAVVPADFGWDDIGSWSALERLWPKDREGNGVRGSVVAIDSRRNVVDAGKRLVALVGVDDLVVVDTEDATLVCRRERAQEVKRVADELRRRAWERYL